MNIIEKEAKGFFSEFYGGVNTVTLGNLKLTLTSKLYDFNRNRDKLDFLKILREHIVLDKEEHLKICKEKWCKMPEERDLGIFVVDQEVDSINEYYTFEPKKDDVFTAEEESKLHSKLNEVIEHLSTLKLGQEVIFEEIESLKNHFNLGKKTWFQLLKGKLVELTVEKVLEKTVVQEIFDTLTDGYASAKHFLK